MGMIGNLLRISTKELEDFLADSTLLEERIYSETDDMSGKENYLDLNKSWEGLFYIITGYPLAELGNIQPPLEWSIFGSESVDDEQDLGYGPARYSTAEQVAQIIAVLQNLSSEQFKQRFKPEEMMSKGIYPEIWDEGNDAYEFLAHYFTELKEFYRRAAQNGQVIIPPYVN